jgi:hypothetical protein
MPNVDWQSSSAAPRQEHTEIAPKGPQYDGG